MLLRPRPFYIFCLNIALCMDWNYFLPRMYGTWGMIQQSKQSESCGISGRTQRRLLKAVSSACKYNPCCWGRYTFTAESQINSSGFVISVGGAHFSHCSRREPYVVREQTHMPCSSKTSFVNTEL